MFMIDQSTYVCFDTDSHTVHTKPGKNITYLKEFEVLCAVQTNILYGMIHHSEIIRDDNRQHWSLQERPATHNLLACDALYPGRASLLNTRLYYSLPDGHSELLFLVIDGREIEF